MSSVGGREIEAAKRRVGAAKAQKAAASSMLDAAHEMAAEAKKLAETAKAMSTTAEKNKCAAKALLQSSDKELQDAKKFLRESEKRLEVIDVDEVAEKEEEDNGNKKRKAQPSTADDSSASNLSESARQQANVNSGGQTSAVTLVSPNNNSFLGTQAFTFSNVNRIQVVGSGQWVSADGVYKRVLDMNDNEFGYFVMETWCSTMIFHEGEHWFVGRWIWELTFGRRKEGRTGRCDTKLFRTRDPSDAALPPQTGWIVVDGRISPTHRLRLSYV